MPSVRVTVRVRPETAEQTLDPFKLDSESGSISLTVAGHGHDFVFDEVFSQDASQEEVFNKSATEICKNVLDGYNGTVFAYGQTGSGKSHSMIGYGENKGVVPLACNEIFERISKNDDPEKSYEVVAMMCEIYNEKVQDLMIEAGKRP